jgi:hypothetical protein
MNLNLRVYDTLFELTQTTTETTRKAMGSVTLYRGAKAIEALKIYLQNLQCEKGETDDMVERLIKHYEDGTLPFDAGHIQVFVS